MSYISNEIPSGTINGSNTIFTTAQNIGYITQVLWDGAPYIGTVSVSGTNTVTLGDAPPHSVAISYYTANSTVNNNGTTFSNLLIKLASKLGNRSTKFFQNPDRAAALNWARTQMSNFNFPELIVVTSLSFSQVTLNGVSVAQAAEPTDINRYVKIWDINSKVEFAYQDPTDFDTGNGQNVFTREFSGGTRYTYVLPDSTTTLNARYAKAIVLFSTDGNVVNEFDSHYDDIIIDGAVTWLSLKGRDLNDLATYEDSFNKQIARMFNNNVEQGGTASHPRWIFYGEKFDILNP